MRERQTLATKTIDKYEVFEGAWLVRITHDKEYGEVSATTWVDSGESICHQRFQGKTLAGARRFAKRWIESHRRHLETGK